MLGSMPGATTGALAPSAPSACRHAALGNNSSEIQGQLMDGAGQAAMRDVPPLVLTWLL